MQNNAKGFITGFITSALLLVFAGYFLVIQPSIQRVEYLRAELNGARTDNQRLIEISGRTTEALEECRSIIGSGRSSIEKLRSIITLLQETDNRVQDSSWYIRDNSNR